VELARWGYTLDFGEVTPTSLSALSAPSSREAEIVELVHAQPKRFKLSVLVPRALQDDEKSDAAFLHNSTGALIVPRQWSPEAPPSVLSGIADVLGTYLGQVQAAAPISVVLNGGERGLDVPIKVREQAAGDADVLAAKGDRSWFDYISQRKAYQEAFLAKAVREAAPAAIYEFYPTGNQYDRSSTRDWDWDFREMKALVDYPSGSFYYKEFNTGWTVGMLAGLSGKGDMLTQVLNQHAYDTALGRPLAYNWLNNGSSVDENSSNFGDIALYVGFLKSAYTSGMLGGIAGYFSYPTGGFDAAFDPRTPPHWLVQMLALGRVHAEFSYVEDMLREGELLPGPLKNTLNSDLPGYEFPSGNPDTRVLIRKRNGEQRWLISAWAADGNPRDVVINAPSGGTVTLHATPAASLYDLRIVAGQKSLTALDLGEVTPDPLRIPLSQPDADK
jgi:hypothetical protein